MAEREIRYCTTDDGVRIAFTSLGSGPAFVMLGDSPAQFSILLHGDRHGSLEHTGFIEDITSRRRLILFDSRGIGLSQRGLDDYSTDARSRDLAAVVDACELDDVDLMGNLFSGPLAVEYAANNPTRVRHLLLRSTYARASEITPWERLAPIVELARSNWKLAWQVLRGIASNDLIEDRELRLLYDETMDGPDAAKWLTDQYQADVRQTAQRIIVPTLVIHSRRDRSARFALGQDLASRIPGARFLPLDQNEHYWSRTTWRTIDYFLRDETPPSEGRPVSSTRSSQSRDPKENATALRTVLFTDLVGHTQMMSRLGDAKGRDVLREHERITRETLKANGGTEVKTMGDGFMASFGSVTKAVECGIALQRAVEAWNTGVGAHHDSPLGVRVGLNAGEPIEEAGDLFGATVILASRIVAKADGGEILVADTVRGLCSGKGFLFADRGEFVAKGFEEPVRVYEVRWREG